MSVAVSSFKIALLPVQNATAHPDYRHLQNIAATRFISNAAVCAVKRIESSVECGYCT